MWRSSFILAFVTPVTACHASPLKNVTNRILRGTSGLLPRYATSAHFSRKFAQFADRRLSKCEQRQLLATTGDFWQQKPRRSHTILPNHPSAHLSTNPLIRASLRHSIENVVGVRTWFFQWLLYRRQIKSGSILHSHFDPLRLIHLQRYTGAVLRGAARPCDSDRVGRSRGALTGADTEPRCAGTARNLLGVKG